MPSRSFAVPVGADVQYLASTAPFANNLEFFTLSAWVYVTALPSHDDPAAYFATVWKGGTQGEVEDTTGPSMSIYSDGSDVLQLWCERTYTGDNPVIFSALSGELALNTWAHICWKLNDDDTCQAFVNGVEVTYDPSSNLTASGTPTFDDSSSPWTVGVDQPGGFGGDSSLQSGFVGQISDVRVYSRPLTLAEIQALAAFGNVSSTGLAAEWPMCGNDPEADTSGNGLDLDVVDATVSDNQPHQFCTGSYYSEPDDRNFSVFPNDSVDVQGTLTYTVPAHPSVTPPTDSRAAGAPVDSRVSDIVPTNSRAPGVYGPGEN